jgi:hypothetical protein
MAELHAPVVAYNLEDTLRIVFTEGEDPEEGVIQMMHVEYADDVDSLGSPIWRPVEDEPALILAVALVDALGVKPDWFPEDVCDA